MTEIEDRAKNERQRELAALLHERHWPLSELAQRFGVNVRTIQRDLKGFSLTLGIRRVPRDRAGVYLKPGMHPVPSIELSVGEARALLFALRHLAHTSAEQDREAASLLAKLATAFPGPIATQVDVTRQQLAARPANAEREGCLRKLTEAWVSRAIVQMRYRSMNHPRGRDLCFEPLLLEPSATTGATYVIGFNHSDGLTATYKLDRVVSVDPHPQVCPWERRPHAPAAREGEAELMARISRSWTGVVLGHGPETDVVVEFHGDAARRVQEGPWHPSRRIESLPGGRVRLHLQLPELFDFAPWVLGWGEYAYVVEPSELREQVAKSLSLAHDQYLAVASTSSASP